MLRKILTIFTLLIILVVALIQGNTLVWRLFALALFIMGLSYLWIYLGKRNISGRLKNSGRRYQAGHAFDIESVIENNSFLPSPFVRVRIGTRLPMTNNTAVINLSSRGSYYFQSQVTEPRRGRYKIGPLVAELSDPFDILHVRHKLDDEEEILIYPETVEVPSFWVGYNASSGIGENSWYNRGSGSVIFGIREYVPGDSRNRIHWPSTAHTGQLIVKEFDSDLSRKVWVILDLSRAAQSGKGDESTDEYSIIIAASLLKKYAGSGCHVGLITQTEDYHFFQARPGQPNLWRIQEALAVFKATGKAPLNQIIDRAQGHFDGNSVAVIVTPSISNEILEATVHTHKRGIPIAYILVDAGSFGGSPPAFENLSRLRAMGVSTYQLKKGDSISEALNGQGKILSTKSGEGDLQF
jgi:uncharacterized protein (DUF58 family)